MESDPAPVDARTLLEHADFVRAVARRLLADESRVDDVLQETWIAALAHPGLRAQGLRAWLSRVARNFALGVRRSEGRRARRERARARGEGVPSAAETAERLSWHRTVVSAVLALDEPYRTTVLLRYFHDLSPVEIAARLSVPASTVRTRLSRALDRLRARLADDGGGRWRERTFALLALPPARGGGASLGLPKGALAVTRKTLLALAAALLLVAGAFVWLGRGDEPRENPPPRPGIETAAASRPEVPAAPPAARAGAEALPGGEVAPAGPSEETPEAAVWLTGTLVDASGSPISGARIRLASAPRYEVGADSGAWEPAEEQGPDPRVIRLLGDRVYHVAGWAIRLSEVVAISDEEGRFRIAAPSEEGQYDLLVIPGGGRGDWYGDLERSILRLPVREWRRGAVERLGCVRVPDPGAIQGRVVDAQGLPLAGRRVTCWPEGLGLDKRALRREHGERIPIEGGSGGVFGGGLRRTVSDNEGRFEIAGVPPGRYTVRSGPKASRRDGVEVLEGAKTGPVVLLGSRARPPLLSGRVVDARSGEPVAASVSSRFTTERGVGMAGSMIRLDGGRFLLANLVPGKHTLVVQAPGYREARSGPYVLTGTDRVEGLLILLEPVE